MSKSNRPTLALMWVLVLMFAAMGLALAPTTKATTSDTHFLVLQGAGCVVTAVATNANCWSHTSGGAGGAGVPGPGNAVVINSASGTTQGTATQNSAMSVASITISASDGTPSRWTQNADMTVAGNFVDTTGGAFEWSLGTSTLTIGGNYLCAGDLLANEGVVDLTSTGAHTLDCTNGAAKWRNEAGTLTYTSASLFDFSGRSVHVIGGTWDMGGFPMHAIFSNPNPGEGSILIDVGATLAAGAQPMTFASLQVDGSMTVTTMNGPRTVTNFQLSTDSPTAQGFGITSWEQFTPTPNPGADAAGWFQDSDTVDATITVTMGGLIPDEEFNLYREPSGSTPVLLETASADGAGTWTVSHTGGWATGDFVEIIRKAAPPVVGPPSTGGGGGGGFAGFPGLDTKQGQVSLFWLFVLIASLAIAKADHGVRRKFFILLAIAAGFLLLLDLGLLV